MYLKAPPQHHLRSMGEGAATGESSPHVMVLIDDTNSYARDLLRGISRHQQHNPRPWSLYLVRRRRFELPPPCLGHWKGHGIIARIDSLEVEKALQATGLPVVNVSGALEQPFFPTFVQDPLLAAKLALDCFEERGFRHYGFVGDSLQQWSLQRHRHFLEMLKPKGRHLAELLIHPEDFAMDDCSGAILQWLAKLPRPLAIWAGDDEMGIKIINACLRGGLRVPEEIAVLGVDNDATVVELSTPPLSSIILDGEGAGYKAAQTLDRWMAGCTPKPNVISALVPRGVAFRRSTDTWAVEDPHVRMALLIIQKEACKGLRVGELVERIPLSRRQLEVRFKSLVHRTLLDEIWRVQCRHACELLESSKLPMIEIAERCGYEHLEHFAKVFKKVIGHPPGKHRRLHSCKPATNRAKVHESNANLHGSMKAARRPSQDLYL